LSENVINVALSELRPLVHPVLVHVWEGAHKLHAQVRDLPTGELRLPLVLLPLHPELVLQVLDSHNHFLVVSLLLVEIEHEGLLLVFELLLHLSFEPILEHLHLVVMANLDIGDELLLAGQLSLFLLELHRQKLLVLLKQLHLLWLNGAVRAPLESLLQLLDLDRAILDLLRVLRTEVIILGLQPIVFLSREPHLLSQLLHFEVLILQLLAEGVHL